MNTTYSEKIALDETLALILNVTKSTSERAGIGWVALDSHGSILSYDAMMIGAANDKLSLKISQQPSHFEHLILSSEPALGTLDVSDLRLAIDNSNCSRITVSYRLPNHYLDEEWIKWKEQWHGSIEYLTETLTSRSLVDGLMIVKEKGRPWVSAVYSANLTGENIPINDVSDDFTVKESLRRYSLYSRGVLYSKDQKAFISGLPEENLAHEFIEPFEIYDNNSIRSILNYWASENRCNIVMYCNQNTLSYLVENDLVDEIIYCLAEPDNTFSDNEKPANKDSPISFLGWATTSCTKSGNGCQLILRKKDVIVEDDNLKHRLN